MAEIPLLDDFNRADEGPPLPAPYDSGGYDGFRVVGNQLRPAEGATEDFTGKLDTPITCMSVDLAGMPEVHGGPGGLTVSPVSADVWGYYFTAGFDRPEDDGDWTWTIAHVPSSDVVVVPGPEPVAGDRIGCDYDGTTLRALHFTDDEWHVRATMEKAQAGLFYPGLYCYSYSGLHSISDYRLENLRGGPGLLIPVEPTGAVAFVTVEELASYLDPRAPRDLTGDVLAELAVVGVTEAIRTVTGQTIDFVEADTVAFTGDGRRDLLLPELPVGEILEVRVDGEVDVEWELLSGGILRRTASAWYAREWARDASIEVDYSHGYAPIPADLKLLALTAAARHYQQGVARQESTGGASVTYGTPGPNDFTRGEQTLLAKYRPTRAPHVAQAVATS